MNTRNRKPDGDVAPDFEDDPNAAGTYASPPCFMHEVDPAYFGLEPASPASDWPTVRAWRRSERKRLIERRSALPPDERRRRATTIAGILDDLVHEDRDSAIGVYWPMDGEPDLRDWMSGLVQSAFRVALPAVVTRDAPVIYRAWTPGGPMAPDLCGIPAPAKGDPIIPGCVIVPLVGFDARRFRLGNGGGYFDRTLAVFEPWPLVIGVGYSEAAIATIHPQPHDVPMDIVVTERGVFGV